MLLYITSISRMRQSAEYGMRAVEKLYRRLLEKLHFNPILQARRIQTLFLLYSKLTLEYRKSYQYFSN